MHFRCPICLESLGEGSSLMATRCGHIYCADCGLRHFQPDRAVPCAVCRTWCNHVDLFRLFPEYTTDREESGIEVDAGHAAEQLDNSLGLYEDADNIVVRLERAALEMEEQREDYAQSGELQNVISRCVSYQWRGSFDSDHVCVAVQAG
ncbi:hypothetical protein K474DRAFT_207752 [Panus rudis PR-1116 ss-1]|nr:hypothetical protein K474DRAFT_207752 [Panus rudis PR-1116 ss-1]